MFNYSEQQGLPSLPHLSVCHLCGPPGFLGGPSFTACPLPPSKVGAPFHDMHPPTPTTPSPPLGKDSSVRIPVVSSCYALTSRTISCLSHLRNPVLSNLNSHLASLIYVANIPAAVLLGFFTPLVHDHRRSLSPFQHPLLRYTQVITLVL